MEEEFSIFDTTITSHINSNNNSITSHFHNNNPLHNNNNPPHNNTPLSHYFALLYQHPHFPHPPPLVPPFPLPHNAKPFPTLAISLFSRAIWDRLTERPSGTKDPTRKSLYFYDFMLSDFFDIFPWASSLEIGGNHYTVPEANTPEAISFLFRKEMKKVFRSGGCACVSKLSFQYNEEVKRLTLEFCYKVYNRRGEEVDWSQTNQLHAEREGVLAVLGLVKIAENDGW